MQKKKNRPSIPRRISRISFSNAGIGGALVLLWCALIFADAHHVPKPQIVYGATIETEETETEIVETECLYSEDDLYRLSHLIAGEVNECDWEMKIAVGSVVLNRIADPRFPSTIGDVIFQKGQYSCTWDGNYDKVPNEETVEAAKYLLTNGSQLPPNVVFQAEFVQGTGIYEILVAPNGVTEYFCTG